MENPPGTSKLTVYRTGDRLEPGAAISSSNLDYRSSVLCENYDIGSKSSNSQAALLPKIMTVRPHLMKDLRKLEPRVVLKLRRHANIQNNKQEFSKFTYPVPIEGDCENDLKMDIFNPADKDNEFTVLPSGSSPAPHSTKSRVFRQITLDKELGDVSKIDNIQDSIMRKQTGDTIFMLNSPNRFSRGRFELRDKAPFTLDAIEATLPQDSGPALINVARQRGSVASIAKMQEGNAINPKSLVEARISKTSRTQSKHQTSSFSESKVNYPLRSILKNGPNADSFEKNWSIKEGVIHPLDSTTKKSINFSKVNYIVGLPEES